MSERASSSHSRLTDQDSRSNDSEGDGTRSKYDVKSSASTSSGSSGSSGDTPARPALLPTPTAREPLLPTPKVKPRRPDRSPSDSKRSGRGFENHNSSRGKSSRSREQDDSRSRTKSGFGRSRRDSSSSINGEADNAREDRSKDVYNGERKIIESKLYGGCDTRLFKLVKRLGRTDEREERKFRTLQNLEECLLERETFKHAIRSWEPLMCALMDVFIERIFDDAKDAAVKCMGVLGHIMGLDVYRFNQWIFNKLNSSRTEDEVKVHLLRAIIHTISLDQNGCMNDYIHGLMKDTHNVLTNADSPDFLIAIMMLIQEINKYYPDALHDLFRSVVDILVGWHIDPSQPEKLILHTSQTLVSFQAYWHDDLQFSFNLLDNFLEDMEAYMEDIRYWMSDDTSEDGNSVPTSEECISKLASLLVAFTTVIKSLDPYFIPGSCPENSIEHVLMMIERVTVYVQVCTECRISEKVLIHGNVCLDLISTSMGQEINMAREQLLDYVTSQLDNKDIMTGQYYVSLIMLTLTLIRKFNTQLPVSFITALFSPNSLIHRLRLVHNKSMQQHLLSIFHAVLALKSVNVLEEAYRHILGDLEQASNLLLESLGSHHELHLVSEVNPMADLMYSNEDAEIAALFDVLALAEIGNTKNNLIAMLALSPTIFELFCHKLLPPFIQSRMITAYPDLTYAVLRALHSHAERHGHFLSSSTLLTMRDSGKQPCSMSNLQVFVPGQPIDTTPSVDIPSLASQTQSTSRHFSSLLTLLTDLHLLTPATRSDAAIYDEVRTLALGWSEQLVRAVSTLRGSGTAMYAATQFLEMLDALLTLGYNGSTEVCLRVASCLQEYLQNTTSYSVPLLNRCTELCSMRLSDREEEVRCAFLHLLNIIPMSITTRYHEGVTQSLLHKEKRWSALRVISPEAFWLVRKEHMAKTPAGTFHSHNFRAIIEFILDITDSDELRGPGWLNKMFYSCQRIDKSEMKANNLTLAALVDRSDATAWFWATWEAAQFCILAKLRTPLGKPQDTFTSIEAALKRYANEVEEAKGGLSMNNNKVDINDLYYTSATDQLKVNLVLQFMQHLEKLLYNAYEGSSAAMASPPKAVRMFFRTNRSTCEEWLLRVRMTVITVAEAAGHHATVVHHAYCLLQDMKDNNKVLIPEFERVVQHACAALCELRSPEAILGIYTWVKNISGRKLAWVKAVAEKAAAKYENALDEYKAALKSFMALDSPLDDIKMEEMEESPTSSPKRGSSPVTGIISIAHLLKREKENHNVEKPVPDPDIVKFVVNEVNDTYMRLGDWESVIEWQQTLSAYRQDCPSTALLQAFQSQLDINYVKALSKFSEHDFLSARDHLELVPGGSLEDEELAPELSWGSTEVVTSAGIQLMRAVTLSVTSELESKISRIATMLDVSEAWCQQVLCSGVMEWPANLQREALMQLYSSSLISNQILHRAKWWTLPLLSNLTLDPHEHDVGISLGALRLLKLQNFLQEHLKAPLKLNLQDEIGVLQLATIRLCRKQSNLGLAQSLLLNELKAGGCPEDSKDVMEALTHVQNAEEESRLERLQLLRLERESCKLVYAQGNTRAAMDTFIAAVHKHCTELKDDDLACADLTARSLLNLVNWLQHDPKYMVCLATKAAPKPMATPTGSPATLSNSQVYLKTLVELSKEHDEDTAINCSPLLHSSDALIGSLLQLATAQDPRLAKGWFSLANWCYKWGRKSVDSASAAGGGGGSIALSISEKGAILEQIPKGTNHDETEKILTLLSQLRGVGGDGTEEDISDQDQALYDDGTETTRKQLLASSMSLQIASDECVERLIDVWKGVVKRVYHYYQLSAKAYFTYLNLNGQAGDSVATNMDGNITATLRVLRLLVKHAWELRGVLEDGLALTPTGPWKGIIPQLFSRLSHPEAYVRQSISELLCRVAQDAPHLIVYPAVVGTSTKVQALDTERSETKLMNKFLSDNEDEDGEMEEENREDEDEDVPNDELQTCFTAIVDTLSKRSPRMISEVELLVSELRRCTLLWDELWLGTLNQHHPDVTRRLTQLENEVKKVMSNAHLGPEEKQAIITEKHNTVLKPTVYVMERVYEISAQPPSTPHEQWFQTTYAQLIEDALVRLREPKDPAHPHHSWALFKQFHHVLQQRAAKRNSLSLYMKEISPRLASLSNTVIAMPGLSVEGHLVTIEAIHNSVSILPTKTKPKKLVFVGSDGRKYPYLFKGLEDLHLDERIMQFLAIVNNMFAKANRGERKLYHARHYSVTPLGARSGLIQWVDGATPLFSLYKRWQQRETSALQFKPGAPAPTSTTSSTAQNNNVPNVPRPSEVFYAKLAPLLKQINVSVENRKEWPLPIVRKVLEELIAETPADLLAKELWCSSSSAHEWWQVTQTYSRSTAVMSMIGYIIGLGDRHLDNLLLDLRTGQVVHIDYNVCFEKGRGLRVPERVPFRMTQNLEAALGVTGLEGVFRLSCEYVIKTMRRGRETLLTLLEAFVYDPLVDWTTANEAGWLTGAYCGVGDAADTKKQRVSKRQMEREITNSMFTIRVAEMKAAWGTNRTEMASGLVALGEAVRGYMEAEKALQQAQHALDLLQIQRGYLEDARIEGRMHRVYSLPQRYEEFVVVKETRQKTLALLQEKMDESRTWHGAHKYGMEMLNTRLAPMQREVEETTSAPIPACFTPVIEFLQGAGQTALITQCESVSEELRQHQLKRHSLLSTTVEALHTYATIVTNFPPKYVNETRDAHTMQWLESLEKNLSVKRCKEIVTEFHETYGPGQTNTEAAHKVQAKLSTFIKDVNTKLSKLLDRRTAIGSDSSYLTLQVQTTISDIHEFIKENGDEGSVCMMGVVVSALSNLNKRYLVMEQAAAAAGERLMDLTSREGDWFLDELHSMSGNVCQLLSIINTNHVNGLLSAKVVEIVTTAMSTTHAVYTALRNLNINFRSVILPEAMKALQSGDRSVITMVGRLAAIMEDHGYIDGLISALEAQVVHALMGYELDESALIKVKKIRVQYDNLLNGNDSKVPALTSGQMLLMAFNGLFSHLQEDYRAMVEMLSRHEVPLQWKKMDVIKEAKSLQMAGCMEATQPILAQLFFLKQLKAMNQFFTLGSTLARVLNGEEEGPCLSEDQIGKPVKRFIADFLRKNMLGLPSHALGNVLCEYMGTLNMDVTAEIELRDIGAECKVSLEELCKKCVDLGLKNGRFQHLQLTQASAVIGASDSAWRKSDLANRLDTRITVHKASLNRAQITLDRYMWLHEAALAATEKEIPPPPLPPLTPPRSQLMEQLKNLVESLLREELELTSVLTQHQTLEATVTQRLKWAAGANHTLTGVLSAFEESAQANTNRMKLETQLSTELVSVANALIHHEDMRTSASTPDAVAADKAFIELMATMQENCQLLDEVTVTVIDEEEAIMLVTPTDIVTMEWMNQATKNIDRESTKLGRGLSTLRVAGDNTRDACRGAVQAIRTTLTTHHNLMSDVRSILKSLAKQEEQDGCGGEIREYMELYKSFSENVTSMLRQALTDPVTPKVNDEVQTLITSLNGQLEGIYGNLLKFAPPLESLKKAEKEDANSTNFATVLKRGEQPTPPAPAVVPTVSGLQQQPELMSSEAPNSPQVFNAKLTPVVKKEKIARDPKTGKAVQERNHYAVSVWRRVKAKLDGRDPHNDKRLTIPEQVDWVVKEATNADNLALLYEGWTPWV